MDFIKYLRTQPDYDPSLNHCIYGNDADFIMLGLCAHQPNILLLRQEVNVVFNLTK